MWLLLLLLSPALASPVPESVRPAVAPVDAPDRFATFLAREGRPAVALACDPLWEEQALLCFRVTEGQTRRFVTAEDLEGWGLTTAGLRALLTERSREVLAEQPEQRAVPDMPNATYWVAAEGDGWAAAGLLHPDRLARRIGGAPILVAHPAEGVLLAWRPGDAELDRVLSIGARKVYEEEDGPITPVVYRWTGERWEAFGEAVPTEGEGP